MTPPAMSPHLCPRCQIRLFRAQANDVVLHGCGQCGGIWLGTACASRIAQVLPQDALELASRASRNAQTTVDTAPMAVCPMCTQPMNRTHIAKARVDLDICGAHGTWYDRHELEQIAKSIRASGWKGAAIATTAGAAAAGAVAMGSMQNPQVNSTLQQAADVALEIGTEVAVDAGIEVAVGVGASVAEHAFDLIGGILSAIFD